MNARTVAFAVFLATFSASAAEKVFRVIPVQQTSSSQFSCGQYCKLRAPLPKGPVRVRIFRGSREELADLAQHRGNIAAGCIEFRTVVVRPRRLYGSMLHTDLPMVQPGWLARDGKDGHFSFVLEEDDDPDGRAVDGDSRIRLSTSIVRAYFLRNAGEFTVLAKVKKKKRSSIFSLPGGSAVAAVNTTSPPSITPPIVPPRAVPPEMCDDVLFLPVPPIDVKKADLEIEDAVAGLQ